MTPYTEKGKIVMEAMKDKYGDKKMKKKKKAYHSYNRGSKAGNMMNAMKRKVAAY